MHATHCYTWEVWAMTCYDYESWECHPLYMGLPKKKKVHSLSTPKTWTFQINFSLFSIFGQTDVCHGQNMAVYDVTCVVWSSHHHWRLLTTGYYGYINPYWCGMIILLNLFGKLYAWASTKRIVLSPSASGPPMCKRWSNFSSRITSLRASGGQPFGIPIRRLWGPHAAMHIWLPF